MDEKLLTSQEITTILKVVKINKWLRDPNVICFGDEKTSVVKVTPNKGVIFINGDADTGFTPSGAGLTKCNPCL